MWQIRDGDYLYPVFVVTAENEEVLTAEQRNLEYWNDMALKGTIYHQPEYKPSTPSQNQTGGTNHGSNGLRDEYDNPEDLYEDTLSDHLRMYALSAIQRNGQKNKKGALRKAEQLTVRLRTR